MTVNNFHYYFGTIVLAFLFFLRFVIVLSAINMEWECFFSGLMFFIVLYDPLSFSANDTDNLPPTTMSGWETNAYTPLLYIKEKVGVTYDSVLIHMVEVVIDVKVWVLVY